MATLGATLSSNTSWGGTRLGAHLSTETLNGTRFGATMSSAVFSPSGDVGVVATLPTAPSTYTPPAGTSISTSAGLVSALQSTTPATLIVEDGVYTNTGMVTVAAAHQVYSRNLLGAEIQFGIVGGQFNNTNGFLVRGLYWHVTDPAKTWSGNQIFIWATNSQGWQILDCKFLGNDSITQAVNANANPALEGLVIRRCEARNFHDNGFKVDSNDSNYVPTIPPIIEDLYAENCVWQTNPRGSDGQSESGLWLGCKATVNRIRAHQVVGYATEGAYGKGPMGWQGLWLGTAARDMTVNDLLVTGQISNGCYGYGPLNGDDTSTITANRIETQSPVKNGWHQEWNNPGARHHPNTQNVIVQDSYFDSTCIGVNYEDGTCNSTVRRTTFVNQTGAAISNHAQGTPNNLYDTTGNNYTGILPGAVTIGTVHDGDYFCFPQDNYSHT